MAKHYDVGVVGWWYGQNYGSMLTYYGLHQALTSMGYSVLMLHEALGYNAWRVQWPEDIAPMRFAKAHYDTTPQCHYTELYQYNTQCDNFICGSDQLWNPSIGRVNGDCFLDFVDADKKRIAYATSFGQKTITEKKAAFFQRYRSELQAFDAVSVREDFGVQVVREHFGVEAAQVIDPVFLLETKEYAALAQKAPNKERGKYLFAFILDPTEEKHARIKEIAAKLGLEKIIVTTDAAPNLQPKCHEVFGDCTVIDQIAPENFLYHMKNAQYVVTDSFHGTCFSTIFNKNFSVFFNTKRGADRFVYLTNWLGLAGRRIDGVPFEKVNLDPIDYTAANETIRTDRARCRAWLKAAIDAPKRSGRQAITLCPKALCTGCGACTNVCPHGALTLEPDELGYYRPVFNEKCTKCGLCQRTCPVMRPPDERTKPKPLCYELIAKDADVHYRSTSGGAFPLLANKVLEQGGAVVGCAWRDDFSAAHILIEKAADLPLLQKSKYLQSYMGDIHRQVKAKLDAGVPVLFSGVPCQIAGLRKFLGKDYENLYLVDMLCGFQPSAQFFKKYVDESFGADNLTAYEFRTKRNPDGAVVYDSQFVTVTTKDGGAQVRGKALDAYQQAYHPKIMLPQHCEKCSFTKPPRQGDLTIGDFWGISRHDLDLPEAKKKGISVVLVNSDKGKQLLESVRPQTQLLREVPLAWVGGNGRLFIKAQPPAPPERDRFYFAITTMSFSQALRYAKALPKPPAPKPAAASAPATAATPAAKPAAPVYRLPPFARWVARIETKLRSLLARLRAKF
ncbi:MAG: Coenzyme F420 hydrogenase/dehydrogenase, beta subunit C-terminal domain [Oscillospiraceae bacterium]|jgi:coenzyme F420-reducing hydrogenase beta subunit|nr:Coenzyme F420 hydrogenase/dehydrogenase, beta subunit C-terminal domain [Oscillospiraceae bacterium]